MPPLVALSFSIAVLGGIWAYLALGPLSGIVLVWAGFIAWGCFFHAGGDNKALNQDDRRHHVRRSNRVDCASHPFQGWRC